MENNRSVDGDTRTRLESDDGCGLNEAETRNLFAESQQIKQFGTGTVRRAGRFFSSPIEKRDTEGGRGREG